MTTLKEQAIIFIRQFLVAVMTAAVILAVLIVGFQGQTNREQELAQVTLDANLAQACVLSLPVDPVKGRDPESVRQCFTQYGIEPPILAVPEP